MSGQSGRRGFLGFAMRRGQLASVRSRAGHICTAGMASNHRGRASGHVPGERPRRSCHQQSPPRTKAPVPSREHQNGRDTRQEADSGWTAPRPPPRPFFRTWTFVTEGDWMVVRLSKLRKGAGCGGKVNILKYSCNPKFFFCRSVHHGAPKPAPFYLTTKLFVLGSPRAGMEQSCAGCSSEASNCNPSHTAVKQSW